MNSQELCFYCRLLFSEEEWDNRHTDSDGEDVHEDCCEICKDQNLESFG